MAATNYVVTVQRPTEVTGLATGYFTAANEFNLIVAKNTHLEIYLITSDGLKLIKDVSIYGQINVLKSFRLPNMNKDLLFVFTAKCHGMILDCRKTDQDQCEILTKGHGFLKVNLVRSLIDLIDLFQDTNHRSIGPPLCSIDSKHGLILLHLSEGVIKLIYLKDFSSKESNAKPLDSFNIKFVFHCLFAFLLEIII